MAWQLLLAALGDWSKDQSTKQIELLTAFMELVTAAISAFTMLESSRMQEPPDTVRTLDKIMNTLSQFISAKGKREQHAAISAMLKEAMELLQKEVVVATLVQGGETNQIVLEINKIAENTKEAVR
jgi:hypothetical protein